LSRALNNALIPHNAARLASITQYFVAAVDTPNPSRAHYKCTGADDQIIINQALTECAGSKVTLLDGNYTISNPIIPQNATEIELMGSKIKIKNAVIANLTVDATAGQADVTVDDASGFFAGQWVILNDSNGTVQGGYSDQTRFEGDCATILSINDNTVTLSNDLFYTYAVSESATLSTCPSAFLIDTKNNIKIHGRGTIDGNKANQVDVQPTKKVDATRVEETRASTGIYIYNSYNIDIEGLTIQNTVLHGLTVHSSYKIRALYNHTNGCHDKGILATGAYDSIIKGNICENAQFEDGISIYASNYEITVDDNICINNPRFGINVQQSANNIDISLANNICKNNGKNFFFGGLRLSSVNDISNGGLNDSYYSVTLAGIDMTITNMRSVVGDKGRGAFFIYGDYIRIFGGTAVGSTTTSGDGQAFCIANVGTSYADNVTINGMMIRDSKVGILAGTGITNVKVKDSFLVGNTADTTDNSGGQLVIS
jgi:hypothetical protein